MPRKYEIRLQPGEVPVGKRYIDTDAKCPYYHSEDAQKIYCDGPADGCWVHLAFPDKGAKKAWKKKYCRRPDSGCRLAKMQEELTV